MKLRIAGVLFVLSWSRFVAPFVPKNVALFKSTKDRYLSGGNRVDAFATAELICHLDDNKNDLATMRHFDFDFYYAVGVLTPLRFTDIFLLEHLLFQAVEEDMLWCWGSKEVIHEAEHNNDRLLSERTTTRIMFTREARRLGIIAFTPGAIDRPASLECPIKAFQQALNATAEECIVMHGKMRILAHEGNDVSYAIAGILDGLERSLTTKEMKEHLVGTNFAYIQFLGDDEQQALNFGREDLCPSDPFKTEPGVCGCGTPDIDDDGDGEIDCLGRDWHNTTDNEGGDPLCPENHDDSNVEDTDNSDIKDTDDPSLTQNQNMTLTSPTLSLIEAPTEQPSLSPTMSPTHLPTDAPTPRPSLAPSRAPTEFPTEFPTAEPTHIPSDYPSLTPSQFPSSVPSDFPSLAPSDYPSSTPSLSSLDESGIMNPTDPCPPHNGSAGEGGGTGVIIGGGGGGDDGDTSQEIDDTGGSSDLVEDTNSTDDATLEPVAEEESDSLGLILALGIPFATALLLAAFYNRRKNTKSTRAAAYEDMMKSDFILVGTGDAPSSYHDGLYHYTDEGTRYLSTRCEHCIETRKNSFYTDYNLGTIMEDEIYEDHIYGMPVSLFPQRISNGAEVDKNSNSTLGGRFVGMDVHRCQSAACTRCNPGKQQSTIFLPSIVQGKDGDIIFAKENDITCIDCFGEQSEV